MPVFHPTIGREGETVTFLKRSLVNLELRVIGFAPRQFNRSAASRVAEKSGFAERELDLRRLSNLKV